MTFRSVAMQPGGPQGFGTVDGVPVLTFPGNPVSAQVSFAMFLREPLERAAGLPGAERVRTAVLAEPLTSPAGKRQLLRGATGRGHGASSGSGLPPRRVDGARGRARGRPGRRDRVGRRDRGGGAGAVTQETDGGAPPTDPSRVTTDVLDDAVSRAVEEAVGGPSAGRS